MTGAAGQKISYFSETGRGAGSSAIPLPGLLLVPVWVLIPNTWYSLRPVKGRYPAPLYFRQISPRG